jgi:hypothetical protein
MIALSLRPSPALSRRVLGQASKSTRIVVSDSRGRPATGVTVRAAIGSGASVEGKTDGSGIVSLDLPSSAGDIHVLAQGYDYAVPVSIPMSGDVFVSLPFCVNSWITPAEFAVLVAGAAALGAGYKWKFEPARVTGEILLGTVAFTIVYRLSCL